MQRCPAAQERLRRAKGTRLGDDRQIVPTLHRAQRHPWLDLAAQADAHCAGRIEQSARRRLPAGAEQPAEASRERQDYSRETCDMLPTTNNSGAWLAAADREMG